MNFDTGMFREKYGPQNRSSDIDLKARNTSSMKAEDPKQCGKNLFHTFLGKINFYRNCPRCGGIVFANEEICSKGRRYHRKCATCRECEAPLTYNTLYDGLSLAVRYSVNLVSDCQADIYYKYYSDGIATHILL